MRIKLDENLPGRLMGLLTDLGHNVDTVQQEGLVGQNDTIIWEAAQRTNRFLITQDLDFSDIRRYRPGTHHGLLLLRLRDPGRKALFKRVRLLFEQENVEDWIGCLVVATERKIRIRYANRDG